MEKPICEFCYEFAPFICKGCYTYVCEQHFNGGYCCKDKELMWEFNGCCSLCGICNKKYGECDCAQTGRR